MMRLRALLCCAALAATTLAGCGSQPVQAPVLERAPVSASRPVAPPPADQRSEMYTVKRGDTMFSIALDHGLDYKDLAAWNNIDNPSRIRPGQQLRIKPPVAAQEAPVTVSPVTTAGRVESRPLGAPGSAQAGAAAGAPLKAEPGAGAAAAQGAIKSEPLARKLPYTPENLALLQRAEVQPSPPAAAAPPAPVPAIAATVPAAPAVAPAPAQAAAATDDEDRVDWGWPVQGKVIAGFSEASNKGLDIAAKTGDAVIASAPGRVVYSGSGLRGYGKLVIIKHNKTYLSAYAHNSVILVKEGQSVVKGQKIAEVGNTDSDKPMLHFEIRKLGKPVDPAKYLPPT